MRFLKDGFTGRVRVALLLAMTIAILNITGLAAFASASGGEEELRRIDTTNVNKATDIKAAGESDADHEAEVAEEEEHESEPGAAEEAEGAAGEEEGHAPAWMIPGWQSIFTVLAVIYFGLGVTFLPRIMAKEEH